MKILITGITGYLGRSLGAELIKNGFDVEGLSRSGSLSKNKSIIPHGIKVHNANCIDKDFIIENKITVVVHTATNYGRNGEGVVDVFDSNLMGSLKLLSASVNGGVKLFVNIGTILNEELNPYSMSKSFFVKAANFLVCTDSLKFLNVELAQFFGPGEADRQFTKKFLIKMQHDKKVRLVNGEQLRDFIFIDDVVSALTCIILNAKSFENKSTLKVGTGKGTKVKDFLKLLHSELRSKSILEFGNSVYRDNESDRYVSNPSQLKIYGWEPKTDINDGVRIMVKSLTL